MGDQAKGSAGQLVMDWEPTFKTQRVGAARRPIILPFMTEELKGQRKQIESTVITGDMNPDDPMQGNKDVGGQLKIPLDMNILGFLLRATMGDPVYIQEVPKTGSVMSQALATTPVTVTITGGTGAYTFSEAQANAAVGDRVIYLDAATNTTKEAYIKSVTNTTTGVLATTLGGSTYPANISAAQVTGIGDNLVSGTPTVTISAGTATFSTAITGLQAGDMIVYDPATLKKCWITAVTSTTVVTVADSLGFAVADQAAVAVQYTGRPSHFRHIFRILPTTALPSMVLEKGFTDLAQYALYTGCKVSSLGLSFGGDSELVAELSFLGADESISATKYATAPAPVAKAVYADRFQQFDATVKEGGSASNGDVIQTMKLTINRNLSGENFVINGGGIRRSLPEGKAAVGGSIAALFEDTTILTKVKGFTKSSLDITLSNTATGSALRLWEPEIKYGDSTPPINGPGGVILEADYTAFKTPSNLASSAVQAELTTKIASFA